VRNTTLPRSCCSHRVRLVATPTRLGVPHEAVVVPSTGHATAYAGAQTAPTLAWLAGDRRLQTPATAWIVKSRHNVTRCLRACNVRHIVPVGRSGPAPLFGVAVRRIASLVACAAFVGVGMVSVTAPAAAKTTPPTAAAASIKTSPYVALGDSYSSAAGVTHRSSQPHRRAAARS